VGGIGPHRRRHRVFSLSLHMPPCCAELAIIRVEEQIPITHASADLADVLHKPPGRSRGMLQLSSIMFQAPAEYIPLVDSECGCLLRNC
jgi:hypothetical protein